MRKVRVSTVLCVFACVCLIFEILLYMNQEQGARRHIFLIEYSEQIRKRAAFLLTVSIVKLGYLDPSQIDEGNEEMTCHFPKLEPFNLLAFKYTWMRSRVFCSRHYPQIYTSSLSNSIIRMEDPAIYKYRNCCYTPFSKIEGQETTVEFSSECIRLEGQRTQVGESVEFARVNCINNEMKTVPVDFFGFIQPKLPHFNKSRNLAPTENSTQTPSSEKPKKRLNVVILLIDSISNLNFQRVMPSSFEYLKNLGAVAMNGFSKVGENTFPNLVPILTGLTINELRQVCWPNRSSFFDSCPFIWKNYSSQGFLTAYGEDAPTQSAFLWERRGFKKAPTDYYWNPLTYQMDLDLGHEWILGANWCYGPRLGMELVTEFLKKMAHQMKNSQHPQNYFQFGLTGSLTHGILRGGKVAENPLLKFLKWFEKHHLNDSVLILMSDHGMRFGDFRSTLQGRIEEQMPFIHFLFPSWFSGKPEYQNAMRNLKKNGKKLTTHFDLYETLLDFLFLQNITNERILQRHIKMSSLEKKPRGISLFLPIPSDRNCEQAGIQDHYCICDTMKEIQVKGNSEIREAAQFIVNFINKMLLDFPKCAQLTLEAVKKAYSAEIVQKKPEPGKSVRFSLVFSTLPNNATFEGTTTRQKNGSWTTSQEMSRVDFYGRQSWCVDDYMIKKFCYCANSQ